ncbi:MAG: GatB/YqeY domain-containing protein [Candidatus Falkowbacteria bacterium]
MPKLLEQINQGLARAMKSKDVLTTSVLRMLVAAMHNKEITLRKDGQAELSDEQAQEAVSSEIKKRRDSVEAYSQGNRQDLVDKENSEIKILQKYLPEQLSDGELEKIIQEVIASGVSVFGKIMGQTMAKVKGKADGGKVGELVKKMLAK